MIFRLVIVSLIWGALAVTAEAQSADQKKNERIMKFVERLDRDQNGTLEPSEMGGAASFIKGLGVDTDRPVSIKSLRKTLGVKSSSKGDKNASSKSAKSEGRIKTRYLGYDATF